MAVLVALALFFSSPDSETARIQAHLAQVEADLRAGDAALLTEAHLRWRARLLDELHRYWTRGRFPRNTYLPDRTPIFVDRSGTRCAVAHLIETSGHGDLVAAVAASRNTAYVAELADDPALVRWLDQHGLTAAEAARIQPSYEPPTLVAGEFCESDRQCVSDRCIWLNAYYGYCSEPCGEDGACPQGPREDAPLACGEHDGERLCLYPSPAPGDAGWPCETPLDCHDTEETLTYCLGGEEERFCSYHCNSVFVCPEAWDCRARDDAGGMTVCVPPEEDGRCSVGGARSTPGLVVLVIAWLVGGLCRRGRARSARKPPTSRPRITSRQ